MGGRASALRWASCPPFLPPGLWWAQRDVQVTKLQNGGHVLEEPEDWGSGVWKRSEAVGAGAKERG